MAGDSKSSSDRNDLELGQLFQVVWRSKLIILLSALLAMLIGAYYAYGVAIPRYTTTVWIVQETDQEPVIDLTGGLGGAASPLGGADQSAINTEIEILRSRGLLESLVQELNLLEDPEFNKSIAPVSPWSVSGIVTSVKSSLGLTSASVTQLNDAAILDATVDQLRRQILVDNLRQSYVYTVTMTTKDPDKSALMANTLAELYIENQVIVKNEANLTATTWLADQVSDLRIELENAETSVKDFNASTDLINADTLAALSRQVKELRERLENVREEEFELSSRIAQLKSAKADGDLGVVVLISNDTPLERLYAQLQEDPERSQSAFENRYEQFLAQEEAELRRMVNQIAALEDSIRQQEIATDQQSDDLVALQQLEREAEASRLLYEYFQSRLKETSLQSGILAPDSRILSRAVVPQEPSAPQKSLLMAVSFMIGLMLASATALLKEFANNSIRSSEELETVTGYSVLGQIPKIPAGRRRKLLDYLTDKPTSAAAEAVRNMRTSILFANAGDPPQVIMSTSSVPGEGKTTQSLALAQNLGGMGKKVLIIEGDVRKRIFREYFNIKSEHGLISLIHGRDSIENLVTFESGLNADVLISEKPDRNAADIFSSPEFEDLISDLRQIYDYIVIDTPPVLAVPDARIIGKLADAIIFTVRWDHTSLAQIKQGLASFEKVGVKVTGLVLSQIDGKKQKSYGYGDTVGNYEGYHSN